MFNKILAFTFIVLHSLSLNAAESIIVGGSGADLETFRVLAKEFNRYNPNIQIKVMPSIGSGGAVRGVYSGRVNFGLMTRQMKEKEKKLGLKQIYYADTAMVFITGSTQPIDNIDIEGLQAIYSSSSSTLYSLKPVYAPLQIPIRYY